MSRAEPTRRRRAPVQPSLTVGVWAAVVTAAVPVLSVVSPGAWMAGVVVIPAAVLATGYIARRAGLAAPLTTLVETVVWAVATVVTFVPSPVQALLRPGTSGAASIPELLADGMREIATGTAPLPPTRALSLGIVGATGALAILIDHVAITTRMPLAAAIGLIAVSLVPSIAVPAPFDAVSFALLAAAVLFIMRAETRMRFAPPPPPHDAGTAQAVRARGVTARKSLSGTSAIAVSIGAVAILIATAVTPLLPQPPARAGSGGAGGSRIDASLDLGRNLRQPHPLTVLTYTTTAADAPYLRVATLSDFTGTVWKPDATATAPLRGGGAFGVLPARADIAGEAAVTSIHIDALTSQYLPVPFAATAVAGVQQGWEAMTGNRTVVAADTVTHPGMGYTVSSVTPDPTLEQIRDSTAHGPSADTRLPRDLPAVVVRDAKNVTRGTHDDYDALIALQAWFRGPAFTYSLTTPVRDGYDTSGAQAVADFLKVKAGYCIHFASAFALMARALGMNARIVVGYLPGELNASVSANGTAEYDVSSAELHSWVEVDFRGIGWVPFDPTKSLGVPTAFVSAAAPQTSAAQAQQAAVEPVPTTAASAPAQQQRQAAAAASGPTTAADASTSAPWGWAAGGMAVVLLGALPMALATVRRRRHDAAARAGDVLSAWASVRDVAIDLGIPVPVGESPRSFATRLQREHGAPDDIRILLDAVEHTSYAPPGTPVDAHQCVRAATAVRSGLYLAVPTRRRLRALLVPRSVFVRPGSEYARSGAPAGTR